MFKTCFLLILYFVLRITLYGSSNIIRYTRLNARKFVAVTYKASNLTDLILRMVSGPKVFKSVAFCYHATDRHTGAHAKMIILTSEEIFSSPSPLTQKHNLHFHTNNHKHSYTCSCQLEHQRVLTDNRTVHHYRSVTTVES